jgi:MoaA/NifB/PqqE/SkfB family radical SAM enzyme
MQINPQHLRLEASSNCQLKCPSCPTAAGETRKSLGGGFLSFRDFKKIVDENPKILHIELSNWGEIFLNPQISQIIEYGYRQGVVLTASNGANFNTVTEEALEALVKYRFAHITCSIDGASQTTYNIYRKGGDFNQVIKNIEKVNHYKKQYRTRFPSLTWQFVAFGHNEHEIQCAQNMAYSLDMDFFVKRSWDPEFSPVQSQRTIEEVKKLDGAEEQEDYWQKEACSQLWNIPQVNWDGRVLGCCYNSWGDFGNAFDSGLSEVVNGEKMMHARQMLLGNQEEKKDIPCTSCSRYKNMQRTQQWMTYSDIKKFQIQYPVPKKIGRLRIWLSRRVGILLIIGFPIKSIVSSFNIRGKCK